jgi:hypothetical protein
MSFEQSAPVFRRVGLLKSVIRIHESLCLCCVEGGARKRFCGASQCRYIEQHNIHASRPCSSFPLPALDSQVFFQEF